MVLCRRAARRKREVQGYQRGVGRDLHRTGRVLGIITNRRLLSFVDDSASTTATLYLSSTAHAHRLPLSWFLRCLLWSFCVSSSGITLRRWFHTSCSAHRTLRYVDPRFPLSEKQPPMLKAIRIHDSKPLSKICFGHCRNFVKGVRVTFPRSELSLLQAV